ncbi:hypothetical protein BKA61DRAFT_349016 [Leptodontidium sp. MPI-SDFR-AT-0119]|nr:hypothetical protein BKA61DRAFT_349016 [Leptodontidium sp. MPI-SDFR-AT-0119]
MLCYAISPDLDSQATRYQCCQACMQINHQLFFHCHIVFCIFFSRLQITLHRIASHHIVAEHTVVSLISFGYTCTMLIMILSVFHHATVTSSLLLSPRSCSDPSGKLEHPPCAEVRIPLTTTTAPLESSAY